MLAVEMLKTDLMVMETLRAKKASAKMPMSKVPVAKMADTATWRVRSSRSWSKAKQGTDVRLLTKMVIGAERCSEWIRRCKVCTVVTIVNIPSKDGRAQG
jgi:hypothetical protein